MPRVGNVPLFSYDWKIRFINLLLLNAYTHSFDLTFDTSSASPFSPA